MKYAVGMGLGAMIYIPSFIKSGSGIQKLIGGMHIKTQQGDPTSLLLFLQNKESRLKVAARLFSSLTKYSTMFWLISHCII
jgi:hypothetical protein